MTLTLTTYAIRYVCVIHLKEGAQRVVVKGRDMCTPKSVHVDPIVRILLLAKAVHLVRPGRKTAIMRGVARDARSEMANMWDESVPLAWRREDLRDEKIKQDMRDDCVNSEDAW